MKNSSNARAWVGLLGGLLVVAGSVSARTIKVTTTLDNDLAAVGECTLRDAIGAANTDSAVGGCDAGDGADRVRLAKNATYVLSVAGAGESNNATGDLDVWEALDIDGRGSTIDGAGIDRVLQILPPRGAAPPTSIGLSSLHVVNGVTGSDGGGIHASGGWHVRLADCVVADNSSSSSGGGIDADTEVLLELQRSTVRDNVAPFAGGISCGSNAPSGTRLVVDQSTVSGNTAVASVPRTGNAGGIGVVNGCHAVVVNSTVSGNSVAGNPMALQGIAGGIGVVGETAPSRLELINTTVSANSATLGGGVASFILAPAGFGTETTFENTIVAGNTDLAGAKSCTTGGTPALHTSLGHNLEDADLCNLIGPGDLTGVAMPGLGPLADNGGPTWTHALLDGSPAIDAADDATCAAEPVGGEDQRLEKRKREKKKEKGCDIGAFELR